MVSAQAGINPIVRVSIEKGGVVDSFDLRLFNDVTPITVENFLNYANATTANGGSYDNSFIHRNSKNFVIQGGGFSFNKSLGGFTYDSATEIYSGGLQKIIVDGTIKNESKLPNIRGAIAMAKKEALYADANSNPVTDGSCTVAGPDCILIDGTGPDSANSQWFINLVNSPFLDGANGGFTVFGEVLQDSMLVIDDIASTATYDFSEIAGFKTLPLANYTQGDPVQESNLIKITSMNELFKISSDIDFGDAAIGSTTDATITIKAAENKVLVIGDIANIKQLTAPFSIAQNDCNNTTLAANTSCDIIARYVPTSINDIAGEFNIEFVDIAASYTFRMHASNAPDISLSRTTGDFGFVSPYDPNNGLPEQVIIIIENLGVEDLIFGASELTVTSGDGSEFNIIDNCQNKTLSPKSTGIGYACAIPVNFVGSAFGDFSFTLTVISNDPDEPRIDIPFTAIVANDSDSVADDTENNAPNNGDGDFDGVLDSLQSNVVSIPNALGKYITLITSKFVKFTEVTYTGASDFRVLFEGAGLEGGVLSFKIPNLIEGRTLSVGLYVPQGLEFGDYKFLTLDPNTLNENWGNSKPDGVGGVHVLRNAQITNLDGSISNRDLVTITLKDGGYGDIDYIENGTINATGLLLLRPKGSDTADNSIGELNEFLLIMLLTVVTLFRSINIRNIYVSRSRK